MRTATPAHEPRTRARPRSRHRPGPTRSERGAAVVEFALVVPVFVVLLMGIIDFASVFNDANSVRQGVREGARQLVVADLDVDGCTGTAAQKVACVTKERIGLDAADTRVRVELASTYQPGEQVTVCAMHQLGSLTGMFGSILDGRVSKSSITMRLEEIDDLSPLVTTSETALPGSDWTWC